MTGLKFLLNKQKEQTNAQTQLTAAASPSNSESEGEPKAPPVVAKASPLSGLLGAAKSAGSNPKPGSILPIPGKSADALTTATAVSDLDFESLADLDVTEVARPEPTRFDDETPATKPTRDLPEGLDKQQLGFVDLLDGMYEMVCDPELLGNVVKQMMIELKGNPQYEKLLSPDDVRLVVKAARNSMGLARVKKTEAKAKRAGGSAKKAAAKVDDDMAAILDGFGLDI